MNTESTAIKDMVREKYAAIAGQDRQANTNSCCGATDSGTYTIMADAYEHLQGYHEDADLGLGCGLPTESAGIMPGQTVLDLGSGAGNDCFVARAQVGGFGKVIGVDFTPVMIEKARANADRLGYNNVEFRQGDIEELPVTDGTIDVVLSNCVLNLVPNKAKVLSEIFRVLKPGGHFSISDIVLEGDLPPGMQAAAELYAGCVSGAMQQKAYLDLIHETGFEALQVVKTKPILIPDDILESILTPGDIQAFLQSGTGIFSITVVATKPGGKTSFVPVMETTEKAPCCAPGSGCC